MIITINKILSKKELNKLLEPLVKKREKKGLFKYFGTAVEKVDALEFQKNARDEWN
jgi:hypothetical protein